VKSWFAVLTKPRAELVAEQNLTRQGYECLFPRVRRMLRTARGLESRVESLFPRYLFLRTDPELNSLAAVRSTKGAVGLVRFGIEPMRVPD
jgi:transcriptional antiterminator RfaH